jgi:hypothetical protein
MLTATVPLATSCGSANKQATDASPSMPDAANGPALGPEAGPRDFRESPMDVPADLEGEVPVVVVDSGSDGPAGDSVPIPPTVCAITATLASLYSDASMVVPAKHAFSLAIDWAANTATTGSGGTAQRTSMVRDNGTWMTQNTVYLSLALAGTSAGERPMVSYHEIRIHPTVDGCSGEATGEYLWNSTDMLINTPFAATLTGVNDKEGPALSVFPAVTTGVHPMSVDGVGASELLPAGSTARWVAADGSGVDMSALPAAGATSIEGFSLKGTEGVSGFTLAKRMLSFATTYRLQILPAPLDSAGNLALELPSITTMADPGLFAQDGFEETVNAFLGGTVNIVASTTLPIPSGNQALRFAPMSGDRNVTWSCDDRFTARLAVPAGAQSVKFSFLSYRSKNGYPMMIEYGVLLGIPGGPIVEQSLNDGSGTPLPSPWTGTLPGSADFSYGGLKQLELPLPAGTNGEVVFDLARWGCLAGASPGLIVDDLRVE